mgnify:CR=1 FL=1|tara:strand:- start:59 stop:706 length:648 start_codon:yes stop_codon:yes gene_type:complete
MSISELNCKEIFKEAYSHRYNWPESFNGYLGKCIFINNQKSTEGDFILESNLKPQITNISDDEIVKGISSQLFEVAIHRVKRNFGEIHKNNNFKYLGKTERGVEMEVFGKNNGDRYIVKDKKINMVFRKIHGVIIEIFVEEFLDTKDGFLSKKYTSQQLDIINFTPKSQKLEYEDNFVNLGINNIWVLESRIIKFVDVNQKLNTLSYFFKGLNLL